MCPPVRPSVTTRQLYVDELRYQVVLLYFVRKFRFWLKSNLCGEKSHEYVFTAVSARKRK